MRVFGVMVVRRVCLEKEYSDWIDHETHSYK